MQKLIYALWRAIPPQDDELLREDLQEALQRLRMLRAAQLNLVDEAVKPAAPLRQIATQPPPDAILQVWVDSANTALRAPLDALLAARFARQACYLVSESQPLRNTAHPPQQGLRTPGFAQIALLRRPIRLDPNSWRQLWLDTHTSVALETQATFEYTQNEVIRALSPQAPNWVAIVEECFPAEAMRDPQVFFDARGDQAKYQRNLRRMMDSVERFLDLGTLDVMATSQYPLLLPR